MCEPIVERRRTLAQLDMNAETAATPQRDHDVDIMDFVF